MTKSELMVMEILWDGTLLDGEGEIMAATLAELLLERYGWMKTSSYTYFTRLLEKNAISRRYPKYTLKPLVSRNTVALVYVQRLLEEWFHGSIIELLDLYLKEKKTSREDLATIEEVLLELQRECK